MTADKDALLPQQGMWKLIAPDGRTWEADSPLKAVSAEQRERIPADVQLARITAALAEKDDGGWTYSSVVPNDVYFIESHFEGKPLMANRGGRWYLHAPLPPLPKGDK